MRRDRLPLLVAVCGALLCVLAYEYRVVLPRHSRRRSPPPSAQNEHLRDLKARALRNPANLKSWFDLGVLYSDAGHFSKAIQAFDHVIQHSPNAWEAYLNRAVARLNLRHFQAAERDVRLALKKGCGKAEGYRWLGEIHLAENALDLAEDAFRQSLKQNPRSYASLSGLAHTVEMQYRNYEGVGPKDIIPLMEKALRVEPGNAQAHAVMARMYYSYGAGETKAIAQLEEALRLDPHNALAHLTLATIYLGRTATPDNLKKAEKEATRAVEIDPTRGEPFYVLGQVFLRQGKSEAAVLFLRKATRLSNLPEAWHLLGQAYMRTGKIREAARCNRIYRQRQEFVEARDDLMAKLASDPDNLHTRYRFAELMMKHDSPRAALSWLKSIVQRQPEHPAAREMMRRIHRRLNESTA